VPTYYTYKYEVALKPGQTLGYTPGRGYYAKGTPTPAPAPPAPKAAPPGPIGDAASGSGYGTPTSTQPQPGSKAGAGGNSTPTSKQPEAASNVPSGPAATRTGLQPVSAKPPGAPAQISDAASGEGYGTRYYTYKKDVPLKPGQTIRFSRGKGYYAVDTNLPPTERPKPTPRMPMVPGTASVPATGPVVAPRTPLAQPAAVTPYLTPFSTALAHAELASGMDARGSQVGGRRSSPWIGLDAGQWGYWQASLFGMLSSNADAGELAASFSDGRLTLSVGSRTWYDDYAFRSTIGWALEFVYGTGRGDPPKSMLTHRLSGPPTATPRPDPTGGFGAANNNGFRISGRSKNRVAEIRLLSTWYAVRGTAGEVDLRYTLRLVLIGSDQRVLSAGDQELVTVSVPPPGAWDPPVDSLNRDAGFTPVTEEVLNAAGRSR
jgi:hypothetical protein